VPGARRGAWALVDCGALSGWAAAEHLRDGPIGLEQAVAEAERATGKARWEWLERVVALDASRPGAWAALADAYRADDRGEKERHVRDLLAGRLPLYIAACGRVQVAFLPGSARDRRFQELREVADPSAGDVQDSPEWKGLAAVASRLSGIAWWPADAKPVGLVVQGPRVEADTEGCEPGAELTLALSGPDCGAKAPVLSSILSSMPTTPLSPGPETLEGRALALAFLRHKKLKADALVIRRVPGVQTLWTVRYESRDPPETGAPIGGIALLNVNGAVLVDHWVDLGGSLEKRGALEELTWFSAGGLRVGIAPWFDEQDLPSEQDKATMLPFNHYGFILVVVERDGSASVRPVVVRVESGHGC